MSEILMSAESYGGELLLLDGRVRIVRKGGIGFLGHGLKGEKEINISSISSIRWKDAGLVNGFIQFSFHGGTEAQLGILEAQIDENTVVFKNKDAPAFKAIRDAIQAQMKRFQQATAPQSASGADEIRKLAQLMEEGILTEEEFLGKKKQILGI